MFHNMSRETGLRLKGFIGGRPPGQPGSTLCPMIGHRQPNRSGPKSAMCGGASLGNRSLGRMPTVIPASSAIALTADHLKKRRYQAFPHGTYGEISAFVCISGDAIMASNRHFPRRGGNHFYHPRRRLCRRAHDSHISLEGADRVSKSRFRGTAIACPSHPALHDRGSAATAGIATDCHCARAATAAATAGERSPDPSRKAGRKRRHQEGPGGTTGASQAVRRTQSKAAGRKSETPATDRAS
jgi:hypothetical protein